MIQIRKNIKKEKAAAFLNLIIVLLEVLGFLKGVKLSMFIYYTNLSNLLALASCILLFICQMRKKCTGKDYSVFFDVLKFLSTVMMTVTFLVVIAILVPMGGPKYLYQGNFIYFHILCPILMFISNAFFDRGLESEKINIISGFMPTLLYAVVFIILNILKIIEGPYPFLKVYKQPVWLSCLWCVLILGIGYGTSFVLGKVRKKRHG